MAAVDPLIHRHETLERALRVSTRLAAFAAYTLAVIVAVLILAPLLPRGEAAVELPPADAPRTYEARAGDTPELVATLHGISLAELSALNPGLGPWLEPGTRLRVG